MGSADDYITLILYYIKVISMPFYSFMLFVLVLKASKVLVPYGTNKARMLFRSLQTTVSPPDSPSL